ncbi:MAG: hypothetical protein R2702_18600 [Acidimicrobiales bacterium]
MAGVLVIAALGFAAVELAAGDGASSPEGAVEALFRAIDQEDAIGAIEALEPSERRLLMSTVGDLQTRANGSGSPTPMPISAACRAWTSRSATWRCAPRTSPTAWWPSS